MSQLCHLRTPKSHSNSPEPKPVHFYRLRLMQKSLAPAPQHYLYSKWLLLYSTVIGASKFNTKKQSSGWSRHFFFAAARAAQKGRVRLQPQLQLTSSDLYLKKILNQTLNII